MGNKDNCLLNHTAPVPWPSPLTRVASLDTPPLSLSLAVGCAHWFPPSVGQHHFTPTGSLCGPGDRPNPPRPRSHQVTHIVRFATHPAQKSISELVRTQRRHFRPLKQLNSTLVWVSELVTTLPMINFGSDKNHFLLGAVHSLRNTYLGSRYTPLPPCNIVINWEMEMGSTKNINHL